MRGANGLYKHTQLWKSEGNAYLQPKTKTKLCQKQFSIKELNLFQSFFFSLRICYNLVFQWTGCSHDILVQTEPTVHKIITWTTKLRLWQSRNMLTVQFVFSWILSLTVEKLIWSLEVKRSTSLNQRQVKRLLIGTCSLITTHPSGTSAEPQVNRNYIKDKGQATKHRKKTRNLHLPLIIGNLASEYGAKPSFL